MTPGTGVFVIDMTMDVFNSYRNNFFSSISLHVLWGMDQTNKVYIDDDDQGRVYQSCKFTDPSGRDFCAREL